MGLRVYLSNVHPVHTIIKFDILNFVFLNVVTSGQLLYISVSFKNGRFLFAD